jgi:hypothetical protein
LFVYFGLFFLDGMGRYEGAAAADGEGEGDVDVDADAEDDF